MTKASKTREIIDALVRSTDASSPTHAIRLQARAAVEQFCAVFGEPTMPLDVDALASFLGIAQSQEAPVHSDDAELVPGENGRVAMRVNPDRPETRKRFSMAHEISHTFFPHYQLKLWCRTDARFRRRENPDDLLEMLCDIGASELVMPLPWFGHDAATVTTGVELLELAKKYNASREAAIRRFAETSERSVQAVFFSWKLKPTEKWKMNHRQQRLFGAPGDGQPVKKLRIDYSIPSSTATDRGYFLPPDKSVEDAAPLDSAAAGTPAEGDCWLDLGPAAGLYHVLAVPVWTPDEDVGPNGENAVGAIIEALDGRRRARNGGTRGPSMFE
jgi:Zn-dependent peptidase ImmA (M78 family)